MRRVHPSGSPPRLRSLTPQLGRNTYQEGPGRVHTLPASRGTRSPGCARGLPGASAESATEPLGPGVSGTSRR